jgi:glucose-6-phosphate 1-dehydrogenase
MLTCLSANTVYAGEQISVDRSLNWSATARQFSNLETNVGESLQFDGASYAVRNNIILPEYGETFTISGNAVSTVTLENTVYAAVENSNTETFVAVKLMIDRQDWYKTPIYIRTGKKLSQKTSKVVVEFNNLITQNVDSPTNKLTLEFAPKETINLQLSHTFGSIQTTESLSCVGPGCLSDYASLINDAFKGDHLYFVTFEQIIQSWRVTDQILAFKESLQPQSYDPGKNPAFEDQIFGVNAPGDPKGQWF